MYMRFFGLKQEPFSLAPDPRYLYMSKRHREALAHLLYGVGGGGGFVLLSGEIGAGKTTVCRCFLEQIPKRCNVAYIFNPKLTVGELLKTICDEFRIPYRTPRGGAMTVKAYTDILNEFLLKTHAVGQNNVLIIDEAQMLSVDVLEQLRLLTNLETNERKLLQIVLIGQPELRTMLERPDLEQLAQRVIARFHLKALSERETEHYIRHRLSVAGMSRAIPFDKKALLRIHEIARGVPRRINLLCDRAMLGAYAHGQQVIDAAIVEKSAREVFGKSEPSAPNRSRFGSGAGIAIVAVTAVALVALLAFAIYGGYRQFATAGGGAAAASGAASSAASGAVSGAASGAVSGTAAAASGSRASAAGRGGAGAVTAPASAASAAAAAAPSASDAAASGASAASAAKSASLVPIEKAPASLPPVDSSADLLAQLKTLGRDQASAWRELASMWNVAFAGGDACVAAARQHVRCYRFPTTLAMIRNLDRPGFMTLRADGGRITHVVLVGLGGDNATVLAESGTRAVSLAALTKLWQGEFGTLWRLPPGYASAVAEGASGPLVDRLAASLARINGEPEPAAGQTMDAALRTKVARFQTAHGLSPLGKAGPTTFMQLNRINGVDEPRLLADAAPR